MRRRSLLAAVGGSCLAAVGMPAARGATGAELPMPAPLRAGSQLVAIAPGTWWENPGQGAEQLRRRIEAAGWRLRIPLAALGRWRWFSAPDRQRLHELRQAMADPKVDAILCVAGGWGSHRLLELGWQPAARPKWLVGFSDPSALLFAMLKAGIGGAVHAGLGGDDDQWQRLVSLLQGRPLAPLEGSGWRGGQARGPLVVSNLTVATNLIGTRWFPDLAGRILVLEDVGEEPYRVDRMLTQWRSSGVLRGVAAIGCGRFNWSMEDILPGDLTMEEVLRDRLGDLNVPLLGNLPVGHGRPNLALPLGRPALLDGDLGRLSLL